MIKMTFSYVTLTLKWRIDRYRDKADNNNVVSEQAKDEKEIRLIEHELKRLFTCQCFALHYEH